jgi:2-keto-4-pentenoate hydratase
MPVTEEVITDLAHRLIAAEQRCVPIEPITSLYPDLTEADAYRVQMAVVITKVERGDRVIGRKVGATSQAIQQLLQIDEPIYGTLLESNQVANGETISLSRLIHPRVECEIAFLLGEDLVGPGIAVTDVLAATQAVMASLEINDPRTREWNKGYRWKASIYPTRRWCSRRTARRSRRQRVLLFLEIRQGQWHGWPTNSPNITRALRKAR